MTEEFTIKITGVKDIQESLRKMEESLTKTEEPLSKSGRFMQLEAFANFPAKGKTFEESWPPLAPSTKKIKAKYYPGQPMMVRTGKLFGGFRIHKGKNFTEVYNPVSYAELHQRGVGKLPRRVLLKLAKRQINEITKIFVNWVVQTIRKSFK